jgi:hypothetical protein
MLVRVSRVWYGGDDLAVLTLPSTSWLESCELEVTLHLCRAGDLEAAMKHGR